ncbi:YfcL family protein [Marinobacterium sediminicola]|uniref:YfcL protein n=1 Tax=Marinobacterium sediminicola TaxID=518898 RepID=A0ABY1RWI2_9GAMM|nr:YfcL family protein [Marinobacterium sediminicola]ULG70392.1 YfcL family protein [Marinobacterium sediminicola]SMR69512.1 YfcL protein [Marinobacterium sediminicola]
MSASLIDLTESRLLAREQAAMDNPDELFYCSYLISHLNLVAADLPESDEAFLHNVQESLDNAFAVDQLSDQDKSGIKSLWQDVCGETVSPIAS